MVSVGSLRRALSIVRPVGIASGLLLACTSGSGDETSATDSSSSATDSTATGTTNATTTETETETETGGEAARPNWYQDIAPLVTRSCVGCHVAGGIGPFAMESYEQTWPWATVIADNTDVGLMPPWHALSTEVCEPPSGFKHDPRLTDAEKTMLRDWADLGAPEGDPKLAAPLPEPQSLDLPNPTKTALMASKVTVEAKGSTLDFFNCLSIDPGISETVFLDGLQLVVGNREILHHVLIYVDSTAESADWPGGVKLDCGGGTGINGPAELISGWVPGSLPMQAPDGVKIPIEAGSRLILNVHYHATGGGAEVDDSTGLAFRWSDTPPEYTSIFKLLGEPGESERLTGPLMIPAGATNHVEEFEWVVSDGGQPFPDTVDARLWSIAHHMHKIGVDMRVSVIDRDSGEETCLLHTPKWDFDWQRFYEYDTPIGEAVRLKSGDKIRIKCIYDNSLGNPAAVEALAEVGLDAPVDVVAGEGTLDEMCIGAFGIALKDL